MSTAKISEPISGDKAYQVRARAALPLLVRQAEAGAPVFYSDLAEELEMPNPRNLNYVLGSIGQSLERLSKVWKSKVPPIQCLVVSKSTGLPGEGIGWFLVKKEDFATFPLRQKRAIVEAELQHVFSYPRWQEVLKAREVLCHRVSIRNSVSACPRIETDSGVLTPSHFALIPTIPVPQATTSTSSDFEESFRGNVLIHGIRIPCQYTLDTHIQATRSVRTAVKAP